MKRVVIALAVIAGSASAWAQARIPIGVITVKDKGFIDPQDVGSRRDIEREMRRCSAIRQVPEDATPTTRLEDFPKLYIVVSRSTQKTDDVFPKYYESLDAMIMVSHPEVAATKPAYIKLIYKVGGAGQWRYAARQVVNELCDWVKANRTVIEHPPEQPQRF